MKSAISLALASLAAHLVNAHYTFPDFIVNGTVTADWEYVRMTDNHYSNGPVTDVTSSQIKCYESTTASQTSTATVVAGSTVGFQADASMGHPGYWDIYMSAANPANLETAGSGSSWFKIWDWPPSYSPSTGLTFQLEGATSFTFPIPAELPSGQYLIRAEQIALHVAGSYGGAQFYIGCAQVNVVGGGKGTPGPTVAFPGAYTGNEPGILIDIYDLPAGYTGYQAPGPALWPPRSGASTTAVASSVKTTSTAKASSTSSKVTSTPVTSTTKTSTKTSAPASSTTASSGGTVPQYGQCGGQGYTGSTVCASPYKCTVSSQYYSQCL